MMKKFLAILFATLLALAACGGDDDTDTASDDTTADDGASTDDAGDSGDDSSDGDADDSEDAGDGGTDVAGVFGNEECEFLFAGSFLNPMAAIQPDGDVDIEDAVDQFQAIADAAPDEISDDMQLLVDRYREFVNLFAGLDTSDFQDPEVVAAFEDAEGIFDEDFEAAGTAVSDWAAENCTTG